MSSNIAFIEVSNVSKMVENGFGDLPGHVSDHVDIRGSFDLGFGMEDLEAWRGKSSIFAGFNVFMLLFLMKALKTLQNTKNGRFLPPAF